MHHNGPRNNGASNSMKTHTLDGAVHPHSGSHLEIRLIDYALRGSQDPLRTLRYRCSGLNRLALSLP